jgi:hypothetical protein
MAPAESPLLPIIRGASRNHPPTSSCHLFSQHSVQSAGGLVKKCCRRRLGGKERNSSDKNIFLAPYSKTWVRIQKPVLTYDPRKFSVTSRARLPNYLKINLKI